MRRTAYRLLVDSSASDLAKWIRRRTAPILTYHGLIPREPPSELRPLFKIHVTAEAFREQMQLLRSRYRVVPLSLLARTMREGASVEGLAAVTFDDGWRSTRTLAAPILRALAVPATVFLATGLIGTSERGLWTQRVWAALWSTAAQRIVLGSLDLPADGAVRRAIAIRRVVSELKALPKHERDSAITLHETRFGAAPSLSDDFLFLDWDEARELAALGVESGAHTIDHEILSRLPLDEAARQAIGSREAVEHHLSLACPLFAYPNGAPGDFNGEHAAFLGEAGFEAAVTQIPGRNAPSADRFRLRRINVGLDHTRETFLAELEGMRHW